MPARRLPTSQSTTLLTCDSVVLPSTTSSVITDICGSIKTNIMMVATPFATADSVLDVTRSDGFKYPAYSDEKTPVILRIQWEQCSCPTVRSGERVTSLLMPSLSKLMSARTSSLRSGTPIPGAMLYPVLGYGGSAPETKRTNESLGSLEASQEPA